MSEEATQIFAYEKKKDGAVILRCFSRDRIAEIPEQLDGVPVRALAPYAFSAHQEERFLRERLEAGSLCLYVPELLFADGGSDKTAVHGKKAVRLPDLPALCGEQLEEIRIPESVRQVGRYCFYNCANLERITFPAELSDWSSGVFTGCHRVKALRVYAAQEECPGMKQVLDELHEELTVDYFWKDQRAQLIFPEFYEEGVENTPARILETHVHGSGILYRNSFRERRFDFAQYDALFPYALAQESESLSAFLAVGRLRFPCRLKERAREPYENYVEMHAYTIGRRFLDERDMDGLIWLLEWYEHRVQCREETDAVKCMCDFLDPLSLYASRTGFAQAQSGIMDFRRRYAPTGRKRLKL